MDHVTASKPTDNVVPLKRGKPTFSDPRKATIAELAPKQASASEAQALLEAADDTFDSWMPCTWPDGMRAFLKNSNVPSTDEAAEAYQAWRRSKVEDERNALLRSIDVKLAASSAPAVASMDPIAVCNYVLKRWIVRRRADSLENADADERDMINHVLPAIGDEDMRTIGRARLAAIRDTFNTRSALRRDDPNFFAAKSGRKVWGLIAKMFADASHPDAGVANPLDPLSPPLHVRDDDPCAKILSPVERDERLQSTMWPNEVGALLACNRVPLHWKVLYIVALYTGLRQSELRHLRVCDVDLENDLLTVANSISRRTGEPKKTKTKAKGRCLIEPSLKPLLAALAEGREASARLLWMAPPEDLAEFTRKHLSYAGVDRTELHVESDDETYQRFVFHGWRHTHLTWRAGRGDSVAELMGTVLHTEFATTLEYIDHAVLHTLRRKKDKLFAPLPASIVEAARGGASPDRPPGGGSAPSSGGRPPGGGSPPNGGSGGKRADAVQFPLGSQPVPVGVSEIPLGSASDPVGDQPTSVVDDALAFALREATRAGAWSAVEQIARALAARRVQP